MGKIKIKKEIRMPMLQTRGWKDADYDKPLEFKLKDGSIANLCLIRNDESLEYANIIDNAWLEIEILPEQNEFKNGLFSKGEKAMEQARKIYAYYTEVYERFDYALRKVGKAKDVMPDSPENIRDFYSGDISGQEGLGWKKDKGEWKKFNPKFKQQRGKRACFKSQQVIKTKTWNDIKKELKKNHRVPSECHELMKLRAQTEWTGLKDAIFKSTILFEVKLMEYVRAKMQARVSSKIKLDDLMGDITLNVALNIILPFVIKKNKNQVKFMKYVSDVDYLKKQRNKIAHGSFDERGTDKAKVRKGIDSMVKLLKFIESN